jgi:hypothetical protein
MLPHTFYPKDISSCKCTFTMVGGCRLRVRV